MKKRLRSAATGMTMACDAPGFWKKAAAVKARNAESEAAMWKTLKARAKDAKMARTTSLDREATRLAFRQLSSEAVVAATIAHAEALFPKAQSKL